MSSSSPFRTESNHRYLWPPLTIPESQFDGNRDEYDRVTHIISEGSPQAWMKPYVENKAQACFTEEAEGIVHYLIGEGLRHNADSDNNYFPVDQQWWDDKLETAARLDDEAEELNRQYNEDPSQFAKKPNNSYKLAKLTSLSPAGKVGLYVGQSSERHRDNAATRGTDVHAVLEEMAKGETIFTDDDTPYLGHIAAAEDFFKEIKPEFIEVESVIYSESYGYAGQFDGIFKVSTEIMRERKQWDSEEKVYKPWVDRRSRKDANYDPDYITVWFDWKTSEKGIKDTVPYQLAAYYFADFIGREDGTRDPIPHCDEFWGVNIVDGKWRIAPCTVDKETFQGFLLMKAAGDILKTSKVQPLYLKGSKKFNDDFAAAESSVEVL